MGSIWDVEGIEWDDIPTVKDLIVAADKKILAREYVELLLKGYGDRGSGTSKKELKRARKRARKLIREVCDTESTPSSKSIIFPKRSCASMDGLWGWGARIEGPAFERDQMEHLAALDANEKRTGGLSAGYSIAYQPWAEVLGYKVWLGGDWCRRERYLLLAYVLNELTVYGLNQEERDHFVELTLEDIKGATEELNNPEGYIAYPSEVCSVRSGFDSSASLGVQNPIEDYKREYNEVLAKVDMRIDRLFENEMFANMQELSKKLKRGYWHPALPEHIEKKENDATKVDK